MTDELAQPSRNPANDGTLTGMLREVMGKMTQGLDDCLPATVVAFDRTSNRATVKPMVQVVTTKGEAVSRAQLVSVPVFQIGGGGFLLNFNLKPGDLGWIKASDRDTSLFLQQYSEQKPNTKRMHSFSDGLFFPDVMRGYTIDGEDAENAVLQTLDGTCRVAIWPDRVKITAPLVVVETEVAEINATTSATITTETATVIASASATIDTPETTITGNVTINGSLQVDGDIDSDGTITGAVDVVGGSTNISVKNHGHFALDNTTPLAGKPIP